MILNTNLKKRRQAESKRARNRFHVGCIAFVGLMLSFPLGFELTFSLRDALGRFAGFVLLIPVGVAAVGLAWWMESVERRQPAEAARGIVVRAHDHIPDGEGRLSLRSELDGGCLVLVQDSQASANGRRQDKAAESDVGTNGAVG